MIGIFVRCLNCDILWERITGYDNPGGTVATINIQILCPNCNSNAWKAEKGED